MSRKFPIPFLAACLMLSGCDSTPDSGQSAGQNTANGLDIPLPDRIRTSLAVDFSQVEGIANVNGRLHQMERSGNQFRVQVPGVLINSEVSINLLFRETLPDGRSLNLARTESRAFSVGATDESAIIEILEDQFSYDFDDDNDGINNINERNDGTDPFVPQDNGVRTITVEFNLPQRIQDPDITQVLAIIANNSRVITRQDSFIRTSGVVPNGSTIDVDIRLQQRFQGAAIQIARAQDQVVPGNENQTLFLQDDAFDFDLDQDGDGVSNIDEIQSGRDPFVP